jgi:Holliday junction DNA helicase RuvA
VITKITGVVERVTDAAVILNRDGLSFEVLVPSGYAEELRDRMGHGESLTLHTVLVVEAGVAMTTMRPRLIGFRDAEERRFYEIFTGVKGLGERKALKAMILPYRVIAGAIEREETATLLRLPGIGKRLADQIVAQLKGKVTPFAGDEVEVRMPHVQLRDFEEEALDILTGQLGFRDRDARERIQRARTEHPGVTDTEQLMQVIFSQ